MSRFSRPFDLFASREESRVSPASQRQTRGSSNKDKPLKRSLTIAGHRTSISLEEPFWRALQQVARQKRKTVASLIFQIDAQRGKTNLSSAIRVFLLEHFRNLSAPQE